MQQQLKIKLWYLLSEKVIGIVFPSKRYIRKAAKNPSPTYYVLPFPLPHTSLAKATLNSNHSQVQYFSVFGKKSSSEVQCLRCMLPLPRMLQRPLFLGVRWNQWQLRVKVGSIKIFLWVHVHFSLFLHLSNTNWKTQKF